MLGVCPCRCETSLSSAECANNEAYGAPDG